MEWCSIAARVRVNYFIAVTMDDNSKVSSRLLGKGMYSPANKRRLHRRNSPWENFRYS